MRQSACIILAAGEGTRMKSATPKVLHKIGGLELVGHVAASAVACGCTQICAVTGPEMEAVETVIGKQIADLKLARQSERLGTAHAVMMAQEKLSGFSGTILILYGDVPLITAATLENLASLVNEDTPVAVLGFEPDDPTGYGRLILHDNGHLSAIIEELDADDQQRSIRACNSGIMAVEASHLWKNLKKIGNDNAKGEYYLTDLVGLTVAAKRKVAVAMCPPAEVAGVNDRVQLAALEAVFQDRKRHEVMHAGATLVSPQTVFFSYDTAIGRDVTIQPHVFIGPGVEIMDGAFIYGFTHLENCRIGANAKIGPFARLRPGAEIKQGAKIGNFVEVKNTTVEAGAKVNHLAYVGDSHIGEQANVGAGVITCNYDGFDKHQTVIGKGAFIGSNSALVAPVEIGDGAYIGSGSVINRNVPDNALAVARQRQIVRDGWAEGFRTRHKDG